ncbi:MAG TPA: hypothetical protein VHX65_17510 [Pirellulales bacterium]|jgi:hypothetical protein|nr:hypothetical protein [Pirellulales bacterium]
MELQEALLQIAAIRRQMARSEQFRGYRAAPVAISALLAFLASAVQSQWISEPATHLWRYLALWIAVAAASLAICLGNVWLRNRRSPGLLQHETTQLALEQFFPCLVAGGLLTIVVARAAPQAAWMLPGLWAILFSMGLFASWRLLPPAILAVAIYYLASGLGALAWTSNREPLSPWEMPLLFGVGQSITAAVLLLSERKGTKP